MTQSLLANPIWHALTGPHAQFAEVHGTARRYRRDVSVFSAVDTLDETGWDDLAACVDSKRGGVLVLRDEPPPAAPGWSELARFDLDQMVATSVDEPNSADWRDLGPDDVDAMVELTALTEPGPFLPGTAQFGGYVGVFDGDRLVTMAGQRVHLPGYTEVSAVCTHPDARSWARRRRHVRGCVAHHRPRRTRLPPRTARQRTGENALPTPRVSP